MPLLLLDMDMDNNEIGREEVLSSLDKAQIIIFKGKELRKKERRGVTCPYKGYQYGYGHCPLDHNDIGRISLGDSDIIHFKKKGFWKGRKLSLFVKRLKSSTMKRQTYSLGSKMLRNVQLVLAKDIDIDNNGRAFQGDI